MTHVSMIQYESDPHKPPLHGEPCNLPPFCGLGGLLGPDAPGRGRTGSDPMGGNLVWVRGRQLNIGVTPLNPPPIVNSEIRPL